MELCCGSKSITSSCSYLILVPKRLFQPFVQVEHSLTRRHDGAGVGLSIAARLAKVLGGAITVESAVGAGSRFIITLPLTLER